MSIKAYPCKESKNYLNIFPKGEKIALILSQSNSEGPYQHQEENEIEKEKIDNTISEVNHYLTLVNTLREPDSTYFKQLQDACQTLFFDLLGQGIKKSLKETPYKTLQLVINRTLLYIPWELLFDGQKFLFEQFAIGRQIPISKNEILKDSNFESQDFNFQKSKIRMLILADSRKDLEEAYNEGELIFEEFSKEKIITVDFHTSDVLSINFVKNKLPNYDIVHYTGHVRYNFNEPHKSGWVLSDGIFSIKDIESMLCSEIQMPTLIFCNACQSGFIEKVSQKDLAYYSHFLNEQFFPSLMSTGVRHYIGTFTLISDKYAKNIGLEFYRQLLYHGKSIGESLKEAREIFKNKFGAKSYSWTNYVLYGTSDYHLIQDQTMEEKTRSPAHPPPDPPPAPDPVLPVSPLNPDPPSPVSPVPNPVPFWNKWKWKGLISFLLLFFLILPVLFIKGRNIEVPSPPVNNEDLIEERIEKARKAIYEILEKREELKKKRGNIISPEDLSGQKDEWASKKLGIVIIPLNDPSEKLGNWVIQKVKSLARRLETIFTEGSHFRLRTWENLDKILKEKALRLSDWDLYADDRILFGKLLYAEIMLLIDVCQESDGIYLCYKIIDTETGEILKSASDIQLKKKAEPSYMAETILNQVILVSLSK